ncbi:hypothetical protein BH18THE2_BH18THE2_37940 [soil metagenome]
MNNEEGNEYHINNINMSKQIGDTISKGLCPICKNHSITNIHSNRTKCASCNTTFIRRV